jgi:5-methylcytosine-specific restriction endonuclease McrA
LINNEFTLVAIGSNLKYYENLGYNIPKYKDDNGRFKVKRGTKILVKINDIPKKANTRIEVKCDYCGNILYPTIRDYYIGHKFINKDSCNDCKNIKTQEIYKIKYGTTSIKTRSEIEGFKIGRNKIDGDIIYNSFLNKGVTPLFKPEDYKGSHQDLPYICNIHKDKGTLYATYNNIIDLECACKYCNIEKGINEKRYSFEYVLEVFNYKNYTLISTNYNNVDEELAFICNYHPEEGTQYATLWHVLNNVNNCTKCRYDMQSRENHWNWQGGISSERDELKIKKEYKEWRSQVYERDNYTCQCCEIRGGNLNAHHIRNFADYPELRLDINNGITLCDNCHSISKYGSFHNIYGTKNNTREQLEEYIQRYNNGEFNELKLKNIS